MKYLLFLFATVFVARSVNAQSAEDSIKAVINTMFEGMKNAEAELVKKSFADSIVFQTISRNKEGIIKVENENAEDFIEFIRKQTPGAADERITFETIKIDGPLAIRADALKTD